jgi:hypothetical protein
MTNIIWFGLTGFLLWRRYRRQYWGGHFLGRFSIKNGTICPLSSHDSSSFKGTCFLTRLIVLPDALYGPHLHWCSHRLFHNCPFQLSFSWGSNPARVKASKEVQNVTRTENILVYILRVLSVSKRTADTPSNGAVVTPDCFVVKDNGSSLYPTEG